MVPCAAAARDGPPSPPSPAQSTIRRQGPFCSRSCRSKRTTPMVFREREKGLRARVSTLASVSRRREPPLQRSTSPGHDPTVPLGGQGVGGRWETLLHKTRRSAMLLPCRDPASASKTSEKPHNSSESLH